MNQCVFCVRQEQPLPLIQSPSLVVMPDKYPLVPGHVLIISREHLPCWGAATSELLEELDTTAQTIKRFLRARYGQSVWVWENGVSGQSVFHAHLHLLPVPTLLEPASVVEDREVQPITTWREVQARYGVEGRYRYAEIAGKRFMLPGEGQVARRTIDRILHLTGIERGSEGPIKTTTPSDVTEVSRHWHQWCTDLRTNL